MHANLIKHFWRTNQALILEKSLADCHCKNVDSILFDDTPGARIRMFVAHEGHGLWKNTFRSNQPLETAFHSHHCDLDIMPVRGYICNVSVTTDNKCLADDKCKLWILDAYQYQSKIKENKGKFEWVNSRILCYLHSSNYYSDGENRYLHLKAQEIHTIYVAEGKFAAWMVYEGKEDESYDSTCYSNADLTNFDDSELYKKKSADYWHKVLEKVYPGIEL